MTLSDTQPTPRKTRTRRSESQWRELHAVFASSGLSVTKFCADHDLSLSSFHLWRNKLSTDSQQRFMPLVAPTVEPTVDVLAWDVELSLGEGVTLRVRRG